MSGFRLLLGAVAVFWLLEAGHALPADGVCWRSTETGGHTLQRELVQEPGIPGVSVFGPGCSSCVVGATCSFTISVMPPATWTAPVSQRRELNVLLQGPALHAGLIEPTQMDDTSFLVTYRVWDAGLYR